MRESEAACVEARALDGVLIVDKPSGTSSGFACRRMQRHFGFRKAGHLGTLDPLATGVLPLCINEGTRLAQFLMHADKEYVATMRLGIVTDTQDSQGRVLSATDTSVCTAEEVRAACARFQGEQLQLPPMYSALKRAGRPLYELARRGETVERQPRPVTVYALEVLALALPEVTLRVHCSGGTYVRTLCHDIGQALGCGAHMSALRRTRCGRFVIGDAIALEEALARDDGAVPGRSFVAMREALQDMPEAMVAPELERMVCHGAALRGPEVATLRVDALPEGGLIKLIAADGRLLSIGQFSRTGSDGSVMRPVRVFAH
ncbi:MAG: tRNA pseudouridine(55) synthase TruB [Deltaproteobacteria bacterium]|nr:tRNA pseudouridine(55) synthase TruB [Deltaproteobacteria bacterium]